MITKLNLGSGNNYKEEYINYNLPTYPNTDSVFWLNKASPLHDKQINMYFLLGGCIK